MTHHTISILDLEQHCPTHQDLLRIAATHLRQHGGTVDLYRHEGVETLVIGDRAGQAEGGTADWGDWDGDTETLRLDADGTRYDVRGNKVPASQEQGSWDSYSADSDAPPSEAEHFNNGR